jgi:hypothetical protein
VNAFANWLENDAAFWAFVLGPFAALGGLAWLLSHLREKEAAAEAQERDDEMAVAHAAGVTVPAVDGSHESLPEDKETDAAFWALAKTAGIEVDR